MKTGSRPQYYRIRRMVQMVREGADSGSLPNYEHYPRERHRDQHHAADPLDASEETEVD